MNTQKMLQFDVLCHTVEALFKDNTYIFKNVGIAVSGGADSIALLYTLHMLRHKLDINLFAIHVEHGIRGESSLQDALFVKDVCNSLDVPLYLEHIDGLANLHAGVETKARKFRYAVFERAYRKFSLDCILLAQHQQDLVESVLMNIARGTGLNGLAGIKIRNDIGGMTLLRPFLAIPKESILQALASNHIEFREDMSNYQDDYTRNFFRLHIIPQIRLRYPFFDKSVYRLTQQANDDVNYFENLVKKIMNSHAIIAFPFSCISLQFVRTLERPVALRVIRKLYDIQKSRLLQTDKVEEYGLSYDSSMRVYQMLLDENIHQIELYKGIFASKSKTYLHFAFDREHIDVEGLPGFERYQAQNAYFVLQSDKTFGNLQFEFAEDIHKNNGSTVQSIPKKLLKKAIFRTRKTGDRIRPFGMKGTKSLKKYLIERQIDKEFRDYIPLLAIGSDILWVCGVGASEDLRCTEEYEKIIIKSTFAWQKERK